MRQILTVGVRARFSLNQINNFWSEFLRLRNENPCEELFWVGMHTDWRNLYKQKVFVKVDTYPEGKTATMLLSEEF